MSNEHNHDHVGKSKFQEAFDAFTPVLSSEQIQAEIKKLIDHHYDGLNNKQTLKFLHSVIDLTSLGAEDNIDQIYNFVKGVNELDDSNPEISPVASICVYPNFAKIVREALTVEDVKVCCVSGGFPSSQTFPEIKVAETSLALADGADEIDIVMHLGNFFSGDYKAVTDEIQELRDVTKGHTLKVILETGALKTPENIQRASILALFSDADFIKTSTGKGYPGASLEAAYVMCSVLKQYHEKFGFKRGFKVSGGVRTTEEALQYLCIVKGILGEEWMTNELFRVGASSLEGDLLKHLS
ncbi:MAG: deoxyribose-phosphate aldolase [Bacteroidales bacterium]|uniref:deoxyribose-phosphate aldolase n=1 Tax=Porphyromonas sp. TaxID=1924944 RepID=UPI002974004E|nr:deoxyribose-phosphate aldolase [Porphyromonas sp.]MDD7437796.1 deoxyribose-phosphate aldolase [Bacteroidales bacterium]MDY3067303.1 deoxyribose-phosphate aldolase [Porphyromonas sp.]